MLYRITQLWGDNIPFYEQYYEEGKGHPALDLVYADALVRALYDGIVVRDEDEPRGLGITATYWVPKLNIAFKHCHMERNNVSVGDKIHKGQIIGIMGKTQTKSAHDHLECIVTDDNGYRIKSAGIGGRIDPLIHVIRSLGDPNQVEIWTWSEWQKLNPEWVTGKYKYGPSTL
jgi:murein DD-endopeptidase MepM/ murein hydrolase activator NlpD